MIQQLRISNSDLLQLLIDFDGKLPSTPGELLHFKQKAKAHLKILHPAQFVRTHHLSEQHPEAPTVKSFIVDGGMLSHDPHEQLIALEQEVEYLRNITGTVSPSIAPVTPGWERPQSLFHNRSSDHESEDPDTHLEDLSEVSSMTGFGTPNDTDLTTAENLEGEDANLIMKAAQHNFRRHTPKGYRKGFRRFTKKGKQLKSKGKG